MKKLRDAIAKVHVDRRIDQLARDNPGDVKPAGEGVSEMRIDYSPGYRVYYKDAGKEIIILCGGDKSTRTEDIAEAKRLAKGKEEADDENE
jgi:putative addiction module killer protein